MYSSLNVQATMNILAITSWCFIFIFDNVDMILEFSAYVEQGLILVAIETLA